MKIYFSQRSLTWDTYHTQGHVSFPAIGGQPKTNTMATLKFLYLIKFYRGFFSLTDPLHVYYVFWVCVYGITVYSSVSMCFLCSSVGSFPSFFALFQCIFILFYYYSSDSFLFSRGTKSVNSDGRGCGEETLENLREETITKIYEKINFQ